MRKEITKKSQCAAPKNDICRASSADVCNGKTLLGTKCELYKQTKISKDYKSVTTRYIGDGSECDWGED